MNPWQRPIPGRQRPRAETSAVAESIRRIVSGATVAALARTHGGRAPCLEQGPPRRSFGIPGRQAGATRRKGLTVTLTLSGPALEGSRNAKSGLAGETGRRCHIRICLAIAYLCRTAFYATCNSVEDESEGASNQCRARTIKHPRVIDKHLTPLSRRTTEENGFW